MSVNNLEAVLVRRAHRCAGGPVASRPHYASAASAFCKPHFEASNVNPSSVDALCQLKICVVGWRPVEALKGKERYKKPGRGSR
jgi:hypothetical protein